MRKLIRQNTYHNQTAYTWRMPVCCGILLMFAVGMPVRGQTVAFISHFNGPQNAFLLKDSEGDEKIFYAGAPLKEGYAITFLNRSAKSVTLKLDLSHQEITYQKSPYKVKPPPVTTRCSWCQVTLSWLKTVSVNAHNHIWSYIKGGNSNEKCEDSEIESVIQSSHSKERCKDKESFSIPMLKNAKLLPGKRNQLYVGWTGGASSGTSFYTVQVYKKTNNSYEEIHELSKHNIPFIHQGESHELRIKEVTLESARHEFKVGEHYKVEITTSGYPPAVGTFQIVSESEDPFLEVPEVRKQFFHIQASWLAKQDNGEWQFEAYQKVGGLQNYSAKVVRWGLSLGPIAQKERW